MEMRVRAAREKRIVYKLVGFVRVRVEEDGKD